MTQSNYPLRLQASLLDEVRRLADEEGASINQFINVAVAEKLSALRLESYFRDRLARADVPAALALLDRLGSEPPRHGDEVGAPRRSETGGLRLATPKPGRRRKAARAKR
jgi:hypothetical protein